MLVSPQWQHNLPIWSVVPLWCHCDATSCNQNNPCISSPNSIQWMNIMVCITHAILHHWIEFGELIFILIPRSKQKENLIQNVWSKRNCINTILFSCAHHHSPLPWSHDVDTMLCKVFGGWKHLQAQGACLHEVILLMCTMMITHGQCSCVRPCAHAGALRSGPPGKQEPIFFIISLHKLVQTLSVIGLWAKASR